MNKQEKTDKRKLFLNNQKTEQMKTFYKLLYWLGLVNLHRQVLDTKFYRHHSLQRVMIIFLLLIPLTSLAQYNYIVEVSGVQHCINNNQCQWNCEEDNGTDDMNYEFDCYETSQGSGGRNYNDNIFLGFETNNQNRLNPRNRNFNCGGAHNYVVASGHNRPASITNLEFWFRTTGDDGISWDCGHGGDCNGPSVATNYSYRNFPMYQWNEQKLNSSGSGNGWVKTRWGNYYANPQSDYGNGEWLGAFYDNTNFTNYRGYMTESEIFDIQFENITDGPDGSVDYRLFGNDNVTRQAAAYVYTETFSARYRMRKNFNQCGLYSFTVGADDGYRLKIDGVTVINNWTDGAYRTSNVSVYLSSGNHDLEIEYYDNTGGNRLSFTYSLSTNPPTNPTSISGDKTICLGGSTTLTAADGSIGHSGTYIWYQGGCGDDAFNQDWNTQPYSLAATTVNSNTNGILNLTAGTDDPMVHMSDLGSFNASMYRYINIRYRTSSATGVQIYYSKLPNNDGLSESQVVNRTYNNDGNWNILSIDMSTSTNWTGSITGWRFDWATTLGANVEIDFITLSQYPIIGQGSSITVNPIVNTDYAVKIKGYCNNTSCATTTVVVQTVPTAGRFTTTALSYCHGTVVNLTNHTLGVGSGSITYQWQYSYDGINFHSLSGNGPSNTFTLNQTTWFRRTTLSTVSGVTCQSSPYELQIYATDAYSQGVLVEQTTTRTCAVNDNQWHYFRDDSARIIAAINSHGQNLGNVTITAHVEYSSPEHLDGGLGVNGTCLGTNELSLKRWYAIVPENQPVSIPSTIRLFFTHDEWIQYRDDIDFINFSKPYTFCYGNTFNPNDLVVSKDEMIDMVSSVSGGPNGSYQYELSIPSFSTFRFHTNGGIGGPLPIELISFTGFFKNDVNILNWITASELNANRFEIERSSDGENWYSVGTVASIGSQYEETLYNFQDENPLFGINYYRLKMIDNDETFEYSSIIKIESIQNLIPEQFRIFPNPTKGKVIIGINSWKDRKAAIQVVDLSGKILKLKKVSLEKGDTQTIIDISNLAIGVYIIVFTDEFGNKWSEKVIKE